MRLGYNEIMIVSKYFEDINDFINLEMGVKRFQGNMERFHFNPIPLNQYSRKLFPNIETFHIYNKENEIFEDGRIFKYVIWYKVNYSKYLKEKKEMNEYKNIEYTKEDRGTYGTTIPIEVTSFGDSCFCGCYDIQEINIPTNVIEIGKYCFYECSSLTTITIKDVKYISEERIFMNEPVLISIRIPENLKIINGKKIEKKDINEFIIPSSITKIGNWCFEGCKSLKSINIPTSFIEIGEGCFYKCSSLTSINIPTNVSELGKYCFYKCSSLTSINIPTNVSELGYGCFRGCSSLRTINIPTSVSEIGEGCFYKCSSLTSINIPSSITLFGNRCFYHCGCEEELKKNKTIPEYCFKEYFY
ncbi:hypothetical protein ENUP19_0036G0041 [Entamoeba nuttalli]|uniref:Leucine rich repeat protein, BspA family protein n=1 Tax=Entamoeba nuttalli TaxID=412467 RepID=A0ABQ0D9E3_9EUKA